MVEGNLVLMLRLILCRKLGDHSMFLYRFWMMLGDY